MFCLQYYRSFDIHLRVCSNKQCFMMKYVFFQWDYRFHDLSFFETCKSFHLLHILFLQPLFSTHDQHPKQCMCSHSPTYNLGLSCSSFIWEEKKNRIQQTISSTGINSDFLSKPCSSLEQVYCELKQL